MKFTRLNLFFSYSYSDILNRVPQASSDFGPKPNIASCLCESPCTLFSNTFLKMLLISADHVIFSVA